MIGGGKIQAQVFKYIIQARVWTDGDKIVVNPGLDNSVVLVFFICYVKYIFVIFQNSLE